MLDVVFVIWAKFCERRSAWILAWQFWPKRFIHHLLQLVVACCLLFLLLSRYNLLMVNPRVAKDLLLPWLILVTGTSRERVSVLLLRTSPKRTTLSLITHVNAARRMHISSWPWHPTSGRTVGRAEVVSTFRSFGWIAAIVVLQCTWSNTQWRWYIYHLQLSVHSVAVVGRLVQK